MPTVEPCPGAAARSPDLVNPVTGDRLWFLTLPQPGEPALEFECELPPHSPGTPLHIHARVAERFECVRGELRMALGAGADLWRLMPGMTLDVPPGTPHRFWNGADHPVRFRSRVTPGAEFERFLRTIYALGAAREVGKSGMPASPLRLALLRELADLYFVGPPLFVQRPVFAALSALATLTGARRRLAGMVAPHPSTSRS